MTITDSNEKSIINRRGQGFHSGIHLDRNGRFAVRQALKTIEPRSYAVLSRVDREPDAGTFSGIGFHCYTAIAPYSGPAVVMSAVSAGLRALGARHVNIIAFPGNHITEDPGMQSLFDEAGRLERMIYICYDKETYMNSGVKKGAAWKKSLFDIVTAHRIPYAATASISNYADLICKVEAASKTDGLSFIHVLAPSPSGWNNDGKESLQSARAMVESGLWPLLESRYDELTINYRPVEFASVSNVLASPGRLKRLDSDSIMAAVNERDQIWESLRRRTSSEIEEDYVI